MITANQIYRTESGRVFRVTCCLSLGEWATVSIDAADPSNRQHTVITEELVSKGGALVVRTRKVRGVVIPFPRTQNDALVREIRHGLATAIN